MATLILTGRAAARLAAITTASADDKKERPILAAVNVEWTEKNDAGVPSIVFTTTDSYRLIAWEIDATTPGVLGLSVEGGGRTLLRAIEFKNVIKRASGHATFTAKDAMVVFDTNPNDAAVIGASHPDKGRTEEKVKMVEGHFPEWRKLIPTFKPADLSDTAGAKASMITALTRHLDPELSGAMDDQIEAMVDAIGLRLIADQLEVRHTAETVGLNSRYLAELLTAYNAGGVPEVVDKPVQVHFDGARPCGFRSNARADHWTALLMPVRL